MHLELEDLPSGQKLARARRESSGIRPWNIARKEAFKPAATLTIKDKDMMDHLDISWLHHRRPQPDIRRERGRHVDVPVRFDAGGFDRLHRDTEYLVRRSQELRPCERITHGHARANQRVWSRPARRAVIEPFHQPASFLRGKRTIVAELAVMRIDKPWRH